MNNQITLWIDQELPSTPFVWSDRAGPIDFSTGWTFRFEISSGGVVVLNKASGISGSADSPNVIVDWAVDELAGLGAGTFDCRLIARRTSDGKDRVYPGRVKLFVQAAPVPI